MKKISCLVLVAGIVHSSCDDCTNQNTISGQTNLVSGKMNTISGDDNGVKGHVNLISGKGNMVLGNDVKISGDANELKGMRTNVWGSGNLVHSSDSSVKGNDNVLAGNKNQIDGGKNIVKGEKNSVVGGDNIISGKVNKIAGQGNTISGSGNLIKGNSNTLGEFDIKSKMKNIDFKSLSGKANWDCADCTCSDEIAGRLGGKFDLTNKNILGGQLNHLKDISFTGPNFSSNSILNSPSQSVSASASANTAVGQSGQTSSLNIMSQGTSGQLTVTSNTNTNLKPSSSFSVLPSPIPIISQNEQKLMQNPFGSVTSKSSFTGFIGGSDDYLSSLQTGSVKSSSTTNQSNIGLIDSASSSIKISESDMTKQSNLSQSTSSQASSSTSSSSSSSSSSTTSTSGGSGQKTIVSVSEGGSDNNQINGLDNTINGNVNTITGNKNKIVGNGNKISGGSTTTSSTQTITTKSSTSCKPLSPPPSPKGKDAKKIIGQISINSNINNLSKCKPGLNFKGTISHKPSCKSRCLPRCR